MLLGTPHYTPAAGCELQRVTPEYGDDCWGGGNTEKHLLSLSQKAWKRHHGGLSPHAAAGGAAGVQEQQGASSRQTSPGMRLGTSRDKAM